MSANPMSDTRPKIALYPTRPNRAMSPSRIATLDGTKWIAKKSTNPITSTSMV